MLAAALYVALQLQQPALSQTASAQPVLDAKQQKAEEQHQKDIESDVAMGKKFVIEVEKEEKLSDNKEYIDRINRIGQELAAIAQKERVEVLWGDKRLNKFDYTFKVLKGDDVNAFSIPGGFIYVYEGLIKYAESDDEIAGVLAHEISHAEQRHIPTLMHNTSKVTTPALIAVLVAIASGKSEAIGPTIMVTSNIMQSFTSKWSVEAEKSADHGGFQYLLKSKYNPTALLTFMERLAQDEHNDPARKVDWGIYQTHPPGRERAEAMTKDMERWNVPIQRSAVTKRYRAEVKPGKEGVDLWFNSRKLFTFGGSDALQRADEAAARVDRAFDQSPGLYEVATDGNDVLVRRRVLFTVQADDALAANKTRHELADAAAQAIKASLYNYAFNIWQ